MTTQFQLFKPSPEPWKPLRKLPNQQTLLELLKYDEKTGFVYWRVTGPGRKLSKLAGGVQNGRSYIKLHGAKYQLHKIIWVMMTGAEPTAEIDHKNGLGSDNSWGNLRLASSTENKYNTLFSKNKHGYPGVSYCPHHKKYRSTIRTPEGPREYLGYFSSAKEAGDAYLKRALALHGEFFCRRNYAK